jgi:hypothetical protein
VRNIEAQGGIADQKYQFENLFPNDGSVEPDFHAMSQK